jgi:hypothetical protein
MGLSEPLTHTGSFAYASSASRLAQVCKLPLKLQALQSPLDGILRYQVPTHYRHNLIAEGPLRPEGSAMISTACAAFAIVAFNLAVPQARGVGLMTLLSLAIARVMLRPAR